MARSSLGSNITAEAINNFFTLKPLSTVNANKQSIHRPGVLQKLMNAGKSAEQRQNNESKDVYTVLNVPGSNKYDDL